VYKQGDISHIFGFIIPMSDSFKTVVFSKCFTE